MQAILYTGLAGPLGHQGLCCGRCRCRGREIEWGRVSLGNREEGANEHLHMFPSDLFGIVCSCQFNSVAQSCLTLCNPMDCSTPDFPVHHQLLELTQTHVHRVSDAIQPSHPLSSPSLPSFSLFQCQDIFQWVSSLPQVAKILELRLQYQSFQWTPKTDFL